MMHSAFRAFRLVDVLVVGAFAFVFDAVYTGFTSGSDRIALMSGCLSALFWLLATVPPIYARTPWRTDTLNGLNAFAAGATGAAVMSSASFGWRVLFS